MRAALSRCCAFGGALVAFAVLAAPALAVPDVPTGLAAVAVSDHEVDLSWTPAPDRPDELQVWRNGVEIDSIPVTSSSYADVAPSPATTYGYELVAVVGGVPTATASVSATTRHDLPNAPGDVAVTSVAGTAADTTDAKVTFTRGAQDADVTYNVTAVRDGTGGTATVTRRFAADDPSRVTVAMSGLPSYTAYHFTVSAVETAGDPPSDPGGTASALPDGAQTLDVAAPTFSPALLTATRASAGKIALSWPTATDAGTGVARYVVCPDALACTTVDYHPLAGSESTTVSGIADDDAKHTVNVTAYDVQGNASAALSAQVLMPKLQPPVVTFPSGAANGCSALVARGTSPDGLDGSTQLYVDGKPWTPGAEIAGPGLAPFQSVELSAVTTFGSELAQTPQTTSAKVYDPAPPTDAPVLRGDADAATRTYTLRWDPITADGAPVTGYSVTSSNVPGATGAGAAVGQSTTPQAQFTGLAPGANYTLSVAALDSCGRPGPPRTTTFEVDDVTAPGTPAITSASATPNGVTLGWTRVTDDVQVEEYQVRRDGVLLPRTVPGNTTTFRDSTVVSPHDYRYEVRAVDTANNPSPWSPARAVSTLDTEAPGPTGTPVPRKVAGGVSLHWAAAIDNSGAIARYVVSRSTDGGRSVVVGSPPTTTYLDRSVPPGANTWTVVAVDAAGNTSTRPRSTDAPLITTAPMAPLRAVKVRLFRATGEPLLRYGSRSGTRMELTFTLRSAITRARLSLRVLRGTAKVKVSLPLGNTGATPGRRLDERRARKGTLVIPLGTMPKGTLRLIVTASQGTPVTLTTQKPTLGQR